ncbi:VOC family protein [Prauserella muralis]|uniref:Glyoxalase n=1 Tax=Prauserella muralis TaxID=588067 RepID=A0A2V4APV2_9PSEU|nr:VOC family protein [Prauserella muralis]PXY22508.1 glyoxalase [Prauserella muralis]TWE28189.1 putative enzyme related to lactoylglutathione lyase [Prauserella muralis]
MTITKLQFVSVPVADHERAKSFYLDTLGFDLQADFAGPHGQFVMVAPKGAESGVVLVDFEVDGRAFGGPVHLQFHSDDVDAAFARLTESGVEASEPRDMPWGRQLAFTDLDGNQISLLQPSAFGDRPRVNNGG